MVLRMASRSSFESSSRGSRSVFCGADHWVPSMLHLGRTVGMPGLPRRACCVVVMRQQEYDGTMRVWRQEQPERRGGARGAAAGRQQAEAIVCLFKQR